MKLNANLIRVIAGMAVACSAASVQAVEGQASVDADTLRSVMALHTLSETEAIERLAAEDLAADIYQRIRHAEIEGYAGSWFDADTGQLIVGLSNMSQAEIVEALGAHPVKVQWSLQELNAMRKAAATRQGIDELLREARIDIRTNRVEIGVEPGTLERAQALLADYPQILITETLGKAGFSSGLFRGADGTRNHTWDLQNGGLHPCSIGVGTPDGYFTAGHCGHVDNEMRTVAGLDLGDVEFSTFGPSWGHWDAGWVRISSGWTPTPTVNGYNDGILPVPAKWSGVREAPIGATVCRYGSGSGGPHCGVLVQRDASIDFGTGFTHFMHGLSVVKGCCTDDGDSGGPHMDAANGQAQGVNVGGNPTNNCSSPSPADEVYFQTIEQVVGLVYNGLNDEKPVLTNHSSFAPTLHDLHCTQTGINNYLCTLGYYNSQGTTLLSWNGGAATSATFIQGYCEHNQLTPVTVVATNPYGSGSTQSSVHCTPIIP